MNEYLKPETINILGGSQAAGYHANCHSEHQAQPESEPSRWEKFKIKAQTTWRTLVNVLQDIKDTIVPIASALGTLLGGLAAFRNRNNQHRGRTAWAP